MSLQRQPDQVDRTAWGGDIQDGYATVKSDIPCRIEITDINEWTVWIMDGSVTPAFGDRFLLDDPATTLYVHRIQLWSRASGAFDHYEIMAKENPPERKWTEESA